MITTSEMSSLLIIAVFQQKGSTARSKRLAMQLNGEAQEIAQSLLGNKITLTTNAAKIKQQLERSAGRIYK